jgi:hypothetical protein
MCVEDELGAARLTAMNEAPQDPLDDVILQVRRECESSRPGIGCKDSVRIKLSRKRERVFSLYEIVNATTGDHHHYNLRIETYILDAGVWSIAPSKSVSLTGNSPNELEILSELLQVARGGALPRESGDFVVLPRGSGLDSDALRAFVAAATASERTDLLVDLLTQIRRNPSLLADLMRKEKEDPADFEKMAAVLNFARYSNALVELKRLVADSENERDFQRHLEEHPWMFGSEYSERLARRNWTRGSDADHMVRRTSDGALELIEIKVPLNGRDLFIYDPSHDCYHPSSPLSKVVGQVMHYLEKLDQDCLRIAAIDGEDVNKIRAKIIIGRDSDNWPQKTLRNLNAHLHRIEIITYDQLINIAERVLCLMRKTIEKN